VKLNPGLMFNATSALSSLTSVANKEKYRKPGKKQSKSVELSLLAVEHKLEAMHSDMMLHFTTLVERIQQVEDRTSGDKFGVGLSQRNLPGLT